MAQFDLGDDSVVVIIGSGAGGGTVANELALTGIKSVVLEAGKRFEMSDIENDEWKMFNKISWLDNAIRRAAGTGRRTTQTCQLGSSRALADRQCIGPAFRCG